MCWTIDIFVAADNDFPTTVNPCISVYYKLRIVSFSNFAVSIKKKHKRCSNF